MEKLPASKVILQGRHLGQMHTVIVDCTLGPMCPRTNFPGEDAWQRPPWKNYTGSNGEKGGLHHTVALLPAHRKEKANFGPETSVG